MTGNVLILMMNRKCSTKKDKYLITEQKKN